MARRTPSRLTEFWLASEELTDEQMATLEQSSVITFGDANRTLVSVQRIRRELPDGVLPDFDEHDLIDLEN